MFNAKKYPRARARLAQETVIYRIIMSQQLTISSLFSVLALTALCIVANLGDGLGAGSGAGLGLSEPQSLVQIQDQRPEARALGLTG
jgi:hypothetical protein